ncbi:hypothetical protein F4860DRAFT_523660 [Xylaria cubensis]|nr:hypothetical protein F4860DRAFT_523660 [Xylaria cubensis]
MNLISAAESARRSQAEATWLRSRVGIEWLRNLRIEETITQWSEIFWRRPGAAPEPLHGKGHEEVKELKRREQSPLLNNGPTDEASTKCFNLNFFDDLVIW